MTLHAVWFDNALHLFAFDAAQHPLANGDLRALLGDLSPDALLASIAQQTSVPLQIAPDHQSVPSLALGPVDAVDFLTNLSPGAAVSDTLRYFAALAGFVLSHIAQQQFFPDVRVSPDNAQFLATWRLLIPTSAEVQHLEKFAAAMPPVCRSYPDAPEASIIVESFLISATDALIRRDIATDEFFLNFRHRTDLPPAPEIRWLGALLGADPQIPGEPAENQLLVEQIRAWVKPLDYARAAAPTQLRFTLEEPFDVEEASALERSEAAQTETPANPDDPYTWSLRFQLLPLEKNSTLIDAAELWAKDTLASGVLSRNIIDFRARLTSELARAAAACPLLERAVRQDEPTHLQLSTLEAHAFINQWASDLREASFSVSLPEWAETRSAGASDFGLLLSLTPDTPRDDNDDDLDPSLARGRGNVADPTVSPGAFGLSALLTFDWRIAVGDSSGGEQTTLSLDEFRVLAEKRTPLVRYNNRWLHIDPVQAQKALDFLATKSSAKLTLAQAFRTAYAAAGGGGSHEAGLPILGLSGQGWLKEFLEQAPSKAMQHLTQPDDFLGTLRPYQLRGLDWLTFLHSLGIGACLADDMGLGKTIEFIALLLHERKPPKDATQKTKDQWFVGPTLLFAPTSVVSNWQRELARFAPSLRVLIHHGPLRLRNSAFVKAVEKHDIVLTSYALAHRDFELLAKPRWHRVALDEAQKIKNPSAASTIAIRKIDSPYKVALTGTPIENHLSELWSIMEVLNPGLLGSAADFRERFAVPIEKLGDSHKAATLRKMIQPFVLRRTKNDPAIVGDLPDKIENRIYCTLTPEQAALYEATTGDMLTQIDAATGMRRKGLILAALTRLKQICNHPALATHEHEDIAPAKLVLDARSGKAERLMEMLEEMLDAPGDAALLFTQYRQMGHLLEKLIASRLNTPTLFLHGGVPAKKRTEMVEDFQAEKSKHRIFILSLRAGGLGLNLTAANHVFHFDRWWNPAVEAQATDRAHRIGQTRKVQVHKFICVGTLEERIDRLLADKRAVADRIVTTGDQWLTSLSTDELRSYLELSADAVAEY